MDDLNRSVLQGMGHAWCERPDCSFHADGWPENAATSARKHTRKTGHQTRVRYEHTTAYERRSDG